MISRLDNPFGSVNAIKKTVKEGIRKVRGALQNFSNMSPEQRAGMRGNFQNILQAGQGLLGSLNPFG